MRSIFVSYRRDDTEGEAGRLFDDLVQEFGEDTVFMDVAGIQAGRDFRKAIDDNISACGVLLAIIGRQWTDAKNDAGQRRLDDPGDFVRLETASALKRDIPVIPVLVHDAKMPRADQLPEDLKELAYRNGVELTHARWNSDVQLLIKQLRPHVDQPKSAPVGQSQAAAGTKAAAPAMAPVPEVSAAASATPAKKPMGMILAVVAAVLVIGVIGAYLMRPKPPSDMVEVPSLVGKPLAAAQQALQDRRLTVGTISREPKAGVARNTVIQEFPNAGEKVQRGSSVALTLSDATESGKGRGTVQEGSNAEPCQILASPSSWNPPGTAEVFIDDVSVGKFQFGPEGHAGLEFPCSPGQHTFKFLIVHPKKSMTCSGSVYLSYGARLNPSLHVQNGQPTCELTGQ